MKKNVMKISEISRYMVIQERGDWASEMWVKAIHNSGRYAQQELVILTATHFQT